MDIENISPVDLLDDSTFEEMFDLESEVERDKLYALLLDKAKELNIKMKFESRFKAFKKEFKEMQKQMLQESNKNKNVGFSQSNITNFNSDKYPELLSGSWICDYDGVRAFNAFGGEVCACYHPIMPVKRLVNIENNKERMVVAWNKDGYWKEHIFDKSILFSANKIVTHMAEYGILTSSENSRYLVKYFCDIESLNIREIPIQLSTSRMGWLNDFEDFMPYVEDIAFDSESAFQNAYDSIKQKGSEDEYIELLKQIRKRNRKEPMLCYVTSLSSILVEICGTLPFIFHLYGEAGKGKTVTSMLAASAWGNPSENGYLADPKSTNTAIEFYLDFLNNLPYICDDISKIEAEVKGSKGAFKSFSEFIYFLCSGTGKKRSNVNLGVNKVATWRNCSITNAEKPLTSEISNGGELLRVIELETAPGYVFDDGAGGKITADIIRNNYGHIGKKFVEVVKELGFDEVRKMHKNFVKKIEEMDTKKEKEGKQIQPIALMLTADKILTDFIIKDGVYLDIDFCFSLIRSNKMMSDNERAYEFILNEVSQYSKRFRIPTKTQDGLYMEPDVRWGYFHEISGTNYVLINNNVFTDMSNRGNFNKKMFIEWAERKDLAKRNKGRNDLRVVADTIEGSFICIKLHNYKFEAEQERLRMEAELAEF